MQILTVFGASSRGKIRLSFSFQSQPSITSPYFSPIQSRLQRFVISILLIISLYVVSFVGYSGFRIVVCFRENSYVVSEITIQRRFNSILLFSNWWFILCFLRNRAWLESSKMNFTIYYCCSVLLLGLHLTLMELFYGAAILLEGLAKLWRDCMWILHLMVSLGLSNQVEISIYKNGKIIKAVPFSWFLFYSAQSRAPFHVLVETIES